jgi:hypothetical protein
VQKDADQKRSAFSQILGLAPRSTSALHLHFIIHPVLFILCLLVENESRHLIIPVAFTIHLFIKTLTYLC